jgi:thiamine monophosphate synthase
VLSEDDSGGSVLYDAACHLRELLRGRAALLIVDRTDIVDAAEADGVLLSPRGATCALAPSTPMSYGKSTDDRGPALLACFTIFDTSQCQSSH